MLSTFAHCVLSVYWKVPSSDHTRDFGQFQEELCLIVSACMPLVGRFVPQTRLHVSITPALGITRLETVS